MSDKEKIFLCFFLAGLFLAALVGVCRYREQLRIPIVQWRKILFSRPLEKKLGCCVTARIGPKDLRLRFVIHCEDQREKEELVKKLPVIQHELLMSATRSDIALAIEQRNFEAIRKHILQVVNNVSTRPIAEMYFDSFFFN